MSVNKLEKIDYKTTPKVLQVKNLRVNFKSDSGLVYAVRGVSFDLYKGETLCIVGESGSGKSVTSKTIMGILANNAIIESGQILYEGEDLVRISEEEFHRIRGNKIGMIFQDPLSSLNPICRVGKQITEATLINRNILKKHFYDLIAKELVAYRNAQANAFYEIHKNKEEISNIDKLYKELTNKKNPNSEEAINNINEYLALTKKNTKDEIDTLNYKISYLEKSETTDNEFFEEDIKIVRLEYRNKRLALFNSFNEKLENNSDLVVFLKERKEFLDNLSGLFKEEHKNLKPLLKKALDKRKAIARVQNKEYAANLKEEHENKINVLNTQLAEKQKELEYHLHDLNDDELAKYKLMIEDEAPKKHLFKKEKQEEINISKLSKKEEKVDHTGNEVFDKVFYEIEDLKKQIDEENDRYINATKITPKEAKKMAINVMKEVGIPLPEKRFKQYPFEFSGGMRQRIVIAIALTANPDILICDEPTTALDVTIQAQILELINKLKRERGLSCIFITHDLGVVANMADRVAVMYAGKIVEYGTSYEIFFNPKHPYTWALLSSIPDLDSKEKLDAIPGTPPDMRFPPKGDAFALRSKYALDIDFKYEPPFFKISDTHYAATWLLHEDAPKMEMPRIVKTRIANSLKAYEEDKLTDNEVLKQVVPEESFEFIDSLTKDSEKQALLSKNLKAYQNYVDGNALIDKETRKLEIDDSDLSASKNELADIKDEDIDAAIQHIKSKCKYKEEYVKDNIILSVNHLKQYFFFGKGINKFKLKAVHDVNFQIKEGECFGIVGESGCGKTTTGRSIIRLYHITSGSIYYKGYRIGAGKRWNDKEIKYTNIRYHQKVKSLKEALKNGEITEEEYKTQLEEVTNHRNNVIKVQKAKISQIKHDDKNARKIRVNDHLIAAKKAEIKELKDNEYVEKAKIEGENLSEEAKKSRLLALEESYKEKINKIDEAILELKKGNHRLISEIQMIFQDPIDSLDPRMTVEDIIQEGLIIQGHRNKAENHQKVVNILEKVGLIADYCNRYPHEFSGGQRQRIGIARALIMNPKLLICDEPISALDVSIRAQIINLLNNLKEEMGLTIMFIAHDLSVVKYFCDRIAVMYFGEIVELATSDELFKHPLHPYTKSLLSAIPKPNPLTEKARVRIPYNPREMHDYSVNKPHFVEILPGHFVLANEEEITKYKKEIAELDSEHKEDKEENSSSNSNNLDESTSNIDTNDAEINEETLTSNEEIANEESNIESEEGIIGTTNEAIEEINEANEAEQVNEVKEETSELANEETSDSDDEISDDANNETTSESDASEALEKQRSGEYKKVYHLKKVDGKWELMLKEGKKVIKTFRTKEEALKYAQALVKSQNGTLLVHASKGKNKGKIQK